MERMTLVMLLIWYNLYIAYIEWNMKQCIIAILPIIIYTSNELLFLSIDCVVEIAVRFHLNIAANAIRAMKLIDRLTLNYAINEALMIWHGKHRIGACGRTFIFYSQCTYHWSIFRNRIFTDHYFFSGFLMFINFEMHTKLLYFFGLILIHGNMRMYMFNFLTVSWVIAVFDI